MTDAPAAESSLGRSLQREHRKLGETRDFVLYP